MLGVSGVGNVCWCVGVLLNTFWLRCVCGLCGALGHGCLTQAWCCVVAGVIVRLAMRVELGCQHALLVGTQLLVLTGMLIRQQCWHS